MPLSVEQEKKGEKTVAQAIPNGKYRTQWRKPSLTGNTEFDVKNQLFFEKWCDASHPTSCG
jgi:hypothetical protein